MDLLLWRWSSLLQDIDILLFTADILLLFIWISGILLIYYLIHINRIFAIGLKISLNRSLQHVYLSMCILYLWIIIKDQKMLDRRSV